MNHLTAESEKFLKDFWSEEEIGEGLKDPKKFLKEVINPFLRDLRKKGKSVPLLHLRGTNDCPILELGPTPE